jgi:hypothetical protein
MTVTVSVDATWRMARVEIFEPHSDTGTVNGYGEVLIEEPTGTASKMPGITPYGDKSSTLGVMPGAKVIRVVGDVLNDAVDVGDGKMILFGDLLEAMALFMEKWRVEDEETRPETEMGHGAVPLSTMPPPLFPGPPKEEELPPPINAPPTTPE